MTIDELIRDLSFTGEGAAYSEKGKRNPIRDDTHHLLSLATFAKQPRRILELGTAFGLSGLCLLRGCPTAELVTCEFDEVAAKKAIENFGKAWVKARVHVGDAGDIIRDRLRQEEDESFDVVFLDHEKKKYLEHFQLLERFHLISRGAVVLADNVIDRISECGDFVRYVLHEYPHAQIIKTECGLLVFTI